MLSEEKETLKYIQDAFTLRSKKMYKQAVEMLYKALTINNDNVEVLYQLGELYYFMNNYSRAIDYLQRVLCIIPKHIESLKLLEEIYEKQGSLENALNILYLLEKYDNSENNILKIVKLSGKLSKTDDLGKYLELENANDEIYYEVAKAYYINKNLSDSKKSLEKSSMSTENLQVLLGKIYYDENNFEKSKEIFAKFSKETSNPEILNYRGLFSIEEMNFTNAIKCFSKAVSVCKKAVYYFNLGNAYFYNGWCDEAQKAYAKAIYYEPNNLDYRYSLAYLYFKNNEFDKSKKEVDAILSVSSEYIGAQILCALLYNQNKEFSKAKLLLEKHLETNSENEFLLISLVKTYSNLQMYSKSERLLDKLIRKFPDNLDYLSEITEIYIAEKEYDKALSVVEDIIKLNENYLNGYVLGAKSAFLKGDLELTKKYSQNSLSLDINCDEGYYYLAKVRFEEKDYDEALECMKRAIVHCPNNSLYYAEISKIFKAKNDIKSAFDYISEAVDIDNSIEYKQMYNELATACRKLK